MQGSGEKQYVTRTNHDIKEWDESQVSRSNPNTRFRQQYGSVRPKRMGMMERGRLGEDGMSKSVVVVWKGPDGARVWRPCWWLCNHISCQSRANMFHHEPLLITLQQIFSVQHLIITRSPGNLRSLCRLSSCLGIRIQKTWGWHPGMLRLPKTSDDSPTQIWEQII